MSLPGETGHIGTKCMDCGAFLPARVLSTPAGYYVGTFCSCCGPYSRESDYFRTRQEAERALATGDYERTVMDMTGGVKFPDGEEV